MWCGDGSVLSGAVVAVWALMLFVLPRCSFGQLIPTSEAGMHL